MLIVINVMVKSPSNQQGLEYVGPKPSISYKGVRLVWMQEMRWLREQQKCSGVARHSDSLAVCYDSIVSIGGKTYQI